MAVLRVAVTVAFKGDPFVGRNKVQPSVILSVPSLDPYVTLLTCHCSNDVTLQ